MSIFAIADLHLSFSCDKPMDIFGKNWENYSERLKNNWNNKIKDTDVVVIPGDISWSTYLEECYEDFKFINELNGHKVLLKGNHDYWWTTINKMNKYVEENNFSTITFLQNNSFQFDNISICGTRGWSLSQIENSESDVKIFDREKSRLILSIEYALKKSDNEILVALHYPPTEIDKENKDFIDIMNFYKIKKCIYGHLHAQSINKAVEGIVDGVELKLVSCDGLNCDPIRIF